MKKVSVAFITVLFLLIAFFFLFTTKVETRKRRRGVEKLPVEFVSTENGEHPQHSPLEEPKEPERREVSPPKRWKHPRERVICYDEGSISGKVLLSDGRPAVGASVVAVGCGIRIFASTNTVGLFKIRRVPSGEYTVEASLAGFVRTKKPGVIVRPSRETSDVNIVLLEGGTLEGEVFDEQTGEPVVAEVCIWSFNPETKARYIYRTKTNEDGAFKIENIFPAVYWIEVSARDYLPSLPFSEEVFDGQTERIEVALRRYVRVNGVVMDERGRPLGGAEVYASCCDREGGGTKTLTADDGSFTLKGLEKGCYIIRALHKNHLSRPLSLYIREGDEINGVEILIDTRLNNFIAGMVVSGGVPVIGASVSVTAEKLQMQTVTDHLGRFAFYGVERSVRLAVKAEGYRKKSLYKVRPGRTDIVVELEPKGVSLEGEVLLSEDSPVSHFSLYVYQMNEWGRERLLGIYPFSKRFPRFHFYLRLPEGWYLLRFKAEGYEPQERVVHLTRKTGSLFIRLRPADR